MTEKTCSLEIEGTVISYLVKRSRQRRKTMAILVHPERGVVVMVPHDTTDSQLSKFIAGKGQWIAKKLSAIEADKLPPRKFTSGELFKYLGDDYPLDVRLTMANADRVILRQERFMVWVPIARFSARQPISIKNALKKWYMSKAEKEINRIVRYMTKESGLRPGKVSVRNLETSWGLCKGTAISFNWRLVMAPAQLIEYVVAHELCHLTHKNHSKAFWATLASIMPDYTLRQAKLKRFGPALKL